MIVIIRKKNIGFGSRMDQKLILHLGTKTPLEHLNHGLSNLQLVHQMVAFSMPTLVIYTMVGTSKKWKPTGTTTIAMQKMLPCVRKRWLITIS